MFSEHTIDSIIAIACIDRNVTPKEKDSLVALLRGGESPSSRLMKYSEVAETIGLSLATVKRLVANGTLETLTNKGNRKSLGILSDSVERFLKGGKMK